MGKSNNCLSEFKQDVIGGVCLRDFEVENKDDVLTGQDIRDKKIIEDVEKKHDEEDKDIDIEDRLEEFRKDIYERYGERIGDKLQNARYGKKTNQQIDDNEESEIDVEMDADKCVSEKEKTDDITNNNSTLSLFLGIFAVVGLILFFFL